MLLAKTSIIVHLPHARVAAHAYACLLSQALLLGISHSVVSYPLYSTPHFRLMHTRLDQLCVCDYLSLEKDSLLYQRLN